MVQKGRKNIQGKSNRESIGHTLFLSFYSSGGSFVFYLSFFIFFDRFQTILSRIFCFSFEVREVVWNNKVFWVSGSLFVIIFLFIRLARALKKDIKCLLIPIVFYIHSFVFLPFLTGLPLPYWLWIFFPSLMVWVIAGQVIFPFPRQRMAELYKNMERNDAQKIAAINAIIHYESLIIQISITIAVGVFISLFVAILSLLKGSPDVMVSFLLIFSLPGLWTFFGFLAFLLMQLQKAARLSESLQFFLRGEMDKFT